MFIAAARVTMDFFNNAELSEKELRLRELIKGLRREFQISIVEVDGFDDPERCVIGMSLVASTEKKARAALGAVLIKLDESSFARVTSEEVEIFSI